MATSRRGASKPDKKDKKLPDEKEKHQEWKIYSKRVADGLEVEKLKEAIGSGNMELLEKAIEDYEKSFGRPNSEEEEWDSHAQLLQTADRKLELLKMRKEVKEATVDDKPPIEDRIERLRKVIRDIKAMKLHAELQTEVHQANSKLEFLKRQLKSGGYILALNRNTLSEIRRYYNPKDEVHLVMRASLLLVGEGEYKTHDWKYCCQMLNPKSGFLKKLISLDVTKISPEIAARSREIMTDDLVPYCKGETPVLEHIRKTSPGAGTFYVWAMSVVDDVLKGKTAANPANIQRQQEILGGVVLSPQQRRKTRGARGVDRSDQVITYSNPPRDGRYRRVDNNDPEY